MAQQETTHGWQLDEEGAAAYERNLVAAFTDAWAADLVAAVGVEPGDRVLDVACGTGIVARRAAERTGPGGEVVGVDVNPAMLATARQAADGLDIAFKEAAADELPFPDHTFDVVFCQVGLQFFPDRPAALAEMARVARPGGRLGLVTCRGVEHQPGYVVLADVVARHVGADAAGIIRSPYTLGDPEEVRALVGGAGFRDVRVRLGVTTARFASPVAFLEAETSSSPLGDVVGRLDTDVRDALVADLSTALAALTDDDGIVFPFQTVVVTARR